MRILAVSGLSEDIRFIKELDYSFAFNLLNLHYFGSLVKGRTKGLAKMFWLVLYKGYLVILSTTPAPTVCPPSRIAKRILSSSATGVINLIFNVTVSPGMTISWPAGNSTSPVTSVVRI